jgi:DNA-directed RNA polymerase specialized sigma24 family protein
MNDDSESRGAGVFATTRWSLVLAAKGDDPRGREAIETLCRAYWFPVYALVRRRGFEVETARDFTQDFFAAMLARTGFSKARREIGRFRSFVAQCVRNFLADQWDRANALKRGGGCTILSLDVDAAENRYREASDAQTPEQLFEQQWAEEILSTARLRLAGELDAQGQSAIVELLDRAGSPDAPTLAEESAQRGIPVNTLKTQMHRARQRHARIIREVVAETVNDPLEVDEELRHLLKLMAG